MLRIPVKPRDNWQATVESQGFHFHTPEDEPYWDESVCYLFNRRQVDQLEAATYALNDLCLEAVQHVIDNNLFHLFQIPPQFVPWVQQSWEEDEFTIYGRFDFAYDGQNAPRLLEYNADTPTSLLEAAVIQWFWFKDVEKNPAAFSPQLARYGSLDQFNSLHERLIEGWKAYNQIIQSRRQSAPELFNHKMYFASLRGHIEDFMTVTSLRDTAQQAGLDTEHLEIENIGFNHDRQLF